MLEDDVVAATKRIVASTSNSQSSSGGKGKGERSRWNRDIEQEQSDGVSVYTSWHRWSDSPGHLLEFGH